jgi:hypothetical protein
MVLLDIDYSSFVSEQQIMNSIEGYDFHEQTGGTFRTVQCILDKEYGTKVVFSEDFSDRCDCKVTNKCRKHLPLVFSNN